jgi:hypothetical protein
MQPLKYVSLAVALAAAWLCAPAQAAEVRATDNGAILISGRIQSGDDARFQSLLSNRRSAGQPKFISTHRGDCFWQQ